MTPATDCIMLGSDHDGKDITIPEKASKIVAASTAGEYPTFYGRIKVLRGATAVLSGIIVRAPLGWSNDASLVPRRMLIMRPMCGVHVGLSAMGDHLGSEHGGEQAEGRSAPANANWDPNNAMCCPGLA